MSRTCPVCKICLNYYRIARLFATGAPDFHDHYAYGYSYSLRRKLCSPRTGCPLFRPSLVANRQKADAGPLFYALWRLNDSHRLDVPPPSGRSYSQRSLCIVIHSSCVEGAFPKRSLGEVTKSHPRNSKQPSPRCRRARCRRIRDYAGRHPRHRSWRRAHDRIECQHRVLTSCQRDSELRSRSNKLLTSERPPA
jgi:hypothetical protein